MSDEDFGQSPKRLYSVSFLRDLMASSAPNVGVHPLNASQITEV